MPNLLIGQDGDYSVGARHAGLGGSSVSLGDSYSLFNNVGGLGRVDATTAFVSYQNRFNLSEFQVVAGGFVYQTKPANFGVSFYRFGDELFSQQKASLHIGNKIQMVSLGASLSFVQYHIESLGSRTKAVIEVGGVVEILPQLILGASVFNINQTNLTENQSIPFMMKAGLSYHPTPALMINIETEKDLELDAFFKAGLEYHLIEKVALRTGFRAHPFRGSIGAGFSLKRFQLDYAFSDLSGIGSIYDLSISYAIGKI
ncbi:MAG: hypothetical protein KI790_16705 [Cyclobacteriaceae bacterium]|nr:hypothetical protein [Cyclobacteriaceae bacterium HetDA_MAG_MS6]